MGAQRLVVIGGDAAGMSAASQARKRRGPGRAGDRRVRARAVHLVLGVRDPLLDQRRRRRPGRPRLPHPGGAPPQRDRHAHAHRGRRDRPGRRARCARATWTPAGSTTSRTTTSSTPRAASRRARRCPGSTRPGCTACRPSTTAPPCARQLDGGARQVVIVGGGYIGLEVAEACQVRGLDVTVVDARPPRRGHVRPGRRPVHRGRRAQDRGRTSCCPTGSPRSRPATDGRGGGGAHDVRPAAARRRRRAGARRAAERRARPRGRDPARPVGWHRGRPPHAHPGRGGVGGGRLRRVDPPALGPARRRRARHAREQAGPGRGHQPRRRLRHVPRRDRHGHHQAVRPRGGAHRPVGEGGRAGRATASSPRWSTRRRGRATSPAPRRSGSS